MNIKRKSLLLFILANLIVFGTPLVFYALLVWKIRNNDFHVKNNNGHLKKISLQNIQKIVLDGGDFDAQSIDYRREVKIRMGSNLNNEIVFDTLYAPYIQLRTENNTLFVTITNNQIDTLLRNSFENYLFKIRLSSIPDSLISMNGHFSYNFTADTLQSLNIRSENSVIGLTCLNNNADDDDESEYKIHSKAFILKVKTLSVDFRNSRFSNELPSEIQVFNLKLLSNSSVQGSGLSYKQLNLVIDSSSIFNDNFYNLNKASVKIFKE